MTAVLVGTGFAPAVADATARWHGPRVIARGHVEETALARLDQGDTLIAWTELMGDACPQFFTYGSIRGKCARVRALVRDADGRYSPTVAVSPDGEHATAPRVFATRGGAMLLWRRNSDDPQGGGGFDASFWIRGQGFSTPSRLVEQASGSILAANDNGQGTAAIAWWDLDADAGRHRLLVTARDGQGFSEPQVLMDVPNYPELSSFPQGDLAVSSDRRAALVWMARECEECAGHVWASFRGPAGRFGPPQPINDRPVAFPRVAWLPDGRALASWVAGDAVEASFAADGAFGRPGRIAARPRSEGVLFHDLLTLSNGTAVAAWGPTTQGPEGETRGGLRIAARLATDAHWSVFSAPAEWGRNDGAALATGDATAFVGYVGYAGKLTAVSLSTRLGRPVFTPVRVRDGFTESRSAFAGHTDGTLAAAAIVSEPPPSHDVLRFWVGKDDWSPPGIRRLRVRPHVVRAGSWARVRAVFTVSSERARVRVGVRRLGHRSVRTLTTRWVGPGRHQVMLPARLLAKLRPGRYVVEATATDAVGNAAGTRTPFRVLPASRRRAVERERR